MKSCRSLFAALMVLLSLLHLCSPLDAVAQGRPDLVWMRGGNLPGDTQLVTYSPDGKWLASGDGQLSKLWRTSDGALMRTFNVTWPTSALVFSPDSRHLFTVGRAGLRFFSIPDGKIEHAIDGAASAADISPDGQTLAVADGSGTVRIFDAHTGALRTSFTAHSANIAGIAFSPNGKRLATGSADKTIKFWNVGTWNLQTTWQGHENEVLSLAFSPDGTLLASCDKGKAFIWNSAGQILHNFGINAHAIRFSPDGQMFGVAQSYPYSGSIEVYATATAGRINSFHAYPWTIAFSPNGQNVATANSQIDGSILEWNITSGKSVKSYGTGYRVPVERVAVSPVNQAVAYLTGYNFTYDHAVDLVSPKTGELIRQLAYAGDPADIFDFQYSGDGQTVLLGMSYFSQSGYGGNTTYWVSAYHASDGVYLGVLSTVSQQYPAFVISPRDPIYVTVSSYPKNVLEIRRISDGSVLRTVPHGDGGGFRMFFSPDGQFFADLNGGIQLYRVSDWTVLNNFRSSAYSGAFSPDGRLLVTGDAAGTLQWWDTRTYALLHTVQGHFKIIDSVAFSPDGL